MLFGILRGVEWIVLDPLHEISNEELMAGLLTISRKRFMDNLLTLGRRWWVGVKDGEGRILD